MKKKTHEEYMCEIRSFDIEVIDRYINARTPILHKCKKCGYEWKISPDNLLRGYGCPSCAGVLSYTSDEFKKMLYKVNPNIQIVGEYINAKTKVKCRCLIDEHEWKAIPRTLISGHGCPECAGNKKKTHSEYVKDVSSVNKNIEVVGEYVNANTEILHKCLIDGHEWMARPNNILHGKGCPKCHNSVGEKQVASYLENNKLCFVRQHTFQECKNVRPLPFDFYVPDYNLCIEYDGIQHFEPRELFGGQRGFEETVMRDAIKTNYCLLNNIQLIRVRYDDDVSEVLDSFFNKTKLIKEVI